MAKPVDLQNPRLSAGGHPHSLPPDFEEEYDKPMGEFKFIETDQLGPCRFVSPMTARRSRFFEGEGIALDNCTEKLTPETRAAEMSFYELAGARREIFFNPEETTVGIVTCGGLCPGLNDVIRAITFCALEEYGVKRVLGFQYGYEGLVARYYHPPVELNTNNTDEIHEKGGTILKSSRGQQPTEEIVNTLLHYKVDILFTIGGDGTQRGARDIHQAVQERGLPISVVGIPKTIDNDISAIQRSFGFETAVDTAWKIITSAHAEAKACRNGIGLVKLMGRQSGWIAAAAALSNSNVNFCLVPEVPFDLEGPNGFIHALFERMNEKDHAVIVVAEGAGQKLFEGEHGRDKSGNMLLHDIGPVLKDRIRKAFRAANREVNIKYFDPSYIIRSTPANASDSEYCLRLGNNAVHAGMAGKTNLIVGLHNNRLVHIPIPLIGKRKQIDPHDWYWQTVLQATHQPANMVNPD
jgi:6-phosphofructokinase 1